VFIGSAVDPSIQFGISMHPTSIPLAIKTHVCSRAPENV
jgi:hypothetical protein